MTVSDQQKASRAESVFAAQSLTQKWQKIVCDNAPTIPSDVALVESVPRTCWTSLSDISLWRRNAWCVWFFAACNYLLLTHIFPVFLLRSAYEERVWVQFTDTLFLSVCLFSHAATKVLRVYTVCWCWCCWFFLHSFSSRFFVLCARVRVKIGRMAVASLSLVNVSSYSYTAAAHRCFLSLSLSRLHLFSICARRCLSRDVISPISEWRVNSRSTCLTSVR